MNEARKTLWILNHYAVTPDLPGGTRHVDFASELVRRGWRVTIFTSAFHHQLHRTVKLAPSERWRVEEVNGASIVWIRTIPYQGNDWRRVWSMVDYMVRSWWIGRKLPNRVPEIGRPVVVLGSSVHLLAVIAAWRLARRYRARFVMEVRDLWPETLVAMGELEARSPVTRLLRALEGFLYRRAERIVTLLPRAEDYISSRGIPREKVVWVPNGVDLSRSEDVVKNLRPEQPFTVMYLGAHGQANALGTLIEAARLLQERGTEVRFVFVGDGPEKGRLIERAKGLGLKNVEFRDPVPKVLVPSTLAEADAVVLVLRDLPLYRYGISLNKLFDYLAAAKPVLLSGRLVDNPVDEAGCGITVPPEDPAALAEALVRLSRLLPDERFAMGRRGRAHVEANHAMPVLAERLARALEGGGEPTSRRTTRCPSLPNGSPAPSKGGNRRAMPRTEQALKRGIGVAISVVALILLALPFAAVALAIKLDSRGPVFFRQERVGRDGRQFRIWKFRTMIVGAVNRGLGLNVARNDSRFTRVGWVLRNSGLDELPQLLNVVAGTMSLVGPRPTLPYQVERYSPSQKRRLEVRPGITSLAVVAGRNALSWNERIELDVWYIDHWSFWLDVKIMLRTLWCVLVTREGLYGKDGVNDPFVDPPGEEGSHGGRN